MEIKYIHEPTDLQCGQAVLAMILSTTPQHICDILGNDRETTLAEMKRILRGKGFKVSDKRVQIQDKSELPPLCMLSLETPRCWHWSLYCEGVFYDPEHGVMDDFPASNRRYYWEITPPASSGLQVLRLFETSDPNAWAEKIFKSDWRAGQYLAELIKTGRLKKLCGESTEVLLLVKNNELVSFCTLAEQDEIANTEMKPWLGFVYTFPEHRGNRCISRLIDHACEIASRHGYASIYVSTDQRGLYESFGFEYTGMEKMSIYGEMSIIYKLTIRRET